MNNCTLVCLKTQAGDPMSEEIVNEIATACSLPFTKYNLRRIS